MALRGTCQTVGLKTRLRTLGAHLQRFPLFRTWRRVAFVLLICSLLLLCVCCWLSGRMPFGDAATLVNLKGMVHTWHEGTVQWEPAYLNQVLGRRHWVRTGPGSGARLLFFDVSTVDVEGETQLNISDIARRRSGNGARAMFEVWFGKIIVRVVRFVDPSSEVQIDTPSASTVVRGAHLSVAVEDDGTTQIDVESGQAEVIVNGETIIVGMGQRFTQTPDGHYQSEQIFQPDAQPVYDKVDAAFASPGDEFYLELTESEMNAWLIAMSQQPDASFRNPQMWFLEDETRIAATVLEPIEIDVTASVTFEVVNGKIESHIQDIAAGVNLPLPASLFDPVLDQLLSQQEDIVEANESVQFSDVKITEGLMTITGRK